MKTTIAGLVVVLFLALGGAALMDGDEESETLTHESVDQEARDGVEFLLCHLAATIELEDHEAVKDGAYMDYLADNIAYEEYEEAFDAYDDAYDEYDRALDGCLDAYGPGVRA